MEKSSEKIMYVLMPSKEQIDISGMTFEAVDKLLEAGGKLFFKAVAIAGEEGYVTKTWGNILDGLQGTAKWLLDELRREGVKKFGLDTIGVVVDWRTDQGIGRHFLVEFIRDTLKAPTQIVDTMKFFVWRLGWIAVIPFIFYASLLAISQAIGYLRLVMTKSSYEANKLDRIFKVDPFHAIQAKIRFPETGQIVDEALAAQGLEPTSQTVYTKALRDLATVTELVQFYWRTSGEAGGMTEVTFRSELNRRGLDQDQQNMIIEDIKLIPPPSDLIRFGVREVWSPTIVEKYKYDLDFPEEFGKWAKKQGYSRDWALAYWRAHWVLPSPSQVYEMLHRGRITKDDVQEYLRVADYAPHWREHLAAISYNVYTRVDVRRMYRLGVFGAIGSTEAWDKVLQAYKDDGYDDEKAFNLTKFTVIDATGERKATNISRVLKLYKKHVFNRQSVIDYFNSIGYTKEMIDELLENADYELEAQTFDKLFDMLRSQYKSGKIDIWGVKSQFEKYGVKVDDITRLIDEWTFEKNTVYQKPTKADISTWYRTGLITSFVDGVSALQSIGYSQTVAELYLRQIDMEKGGV